MSVTAQLEALWLPTYPVGAPEKNPVFFEKRVYQGSCGKVYPVPFIDKVFDEAHPVAYRAARLENEFVRLVMLPEIGGRILIGQDKSNADYDFFYRQDVIKPALVGLAGPWISGGVEFNWPQHHRPGTFMPADVCIEEEADGARTIWHSEHDPLNRLKGMHGLRLRPGSSLIELRVRLFNRTPLTQTFLWWANVAARVHERYQSFFPPDVHYVADHAVRAQSTFPRARQPYYGVPYQQRPGADDLSWYKNIPVPTSYMVCETGFDFFGGYDHAAAGGFIHVADRHIAPGKKQWTWGNHPFGFAWDRELTDRGGPYIELMAGAFTDNQPDFSYLLPYETRTFSQFWWPFQGLGPVQAANTRAALRLVVRDDHQIDLGVVVPAPLTGARLIVRDADRVLLDERADLRPGEPWHGHPAPRADSRPEALSFQLFDGSGTEVLAYRPPVVDTTRRTRAVAVEPPAPAETPSCDELFLTGEHLDQYRHPTRAPEHYWHEALRRDPGDARCHLALGKRLLRKGLFEEAAGHFEQAVNRLTSRHPNPSTGEAHYYLGLTREWQGRDAEAGALLAKATWNYEWRGAAFCRLAALESRGQNFPGALAHADSALDAQRQNSHARVLRAIACRQLGRVAEANRELSEVLAADPLDHWARYEAARASGDFSRFLELTRNDAQTILDLAFDYADAGRFDDAISLLDLHHQSPVTAVAVPNPLERSAATRYTLAWLHSRRGDTASGSAALTVARRQSPHYFFPSRLHEFAALEWAAAQPGPDPVAQFALGNGYYDLKRYAHAIAAWEQSIAAGAAFATVYRNLGLARWNIDRNGVAARAAYERALALDPNDARLVFEFDQLRKKLNESPADRLAWLEGHWNQVLDRDDASVELATLYNLAGRPEDALALLTTRRFHPWEGGEGRVLRQYTAARLLLGRAALLRCEPASALEHFTRALQTPENLSEAYHPLQATADVSYWLGRALQALGRNEEATAQFTACANEAGDFAEMSVTAHSPLSYYRGRALLALGRKAEATQFFQALRDYAAPRIGQPAQIDYFATSLPNLLVFEEDLTARRDADHHLLAALAAHGLGDLDAAKRHLSHSLAINQADLTATDLARQMAQASEASALR